ncbi:classical arabinogalactan protein 9-like [Phaseolus vulgaris]|uniref:classical arabinogalactan protein 9-like n=1 Tax=Phaseolus vulgaris TaxID=3885 RepID=UPI0035CC55CF
MDKQRQLKLAQILKSKGEASSKGVGDPIPPTSETTPTSPNLRPQHPPTTASPPAIPSPNHPQNSPPPIAAIPLALAETPAEPAPLDKGKRVVVVPSEDEEDSAEGKVFKRRRTSRAALQVATSTTSSSHGAESLRENPPSATSPPQPMALEGGTETEPILAPPLAPKLPLPIQEILRGYLEKMSPSTQSEGPKKEGMNYYMGAFVACANTWRA